MLDPPTRPTVQLRPESRRKLVRVFMRLSRIPIDGVTGLPMAPGPAGVGGTVPPGTGGSGSGTTTAGAVQNEGVQLAPRRWLNFLGSLINAVDDSANDRVNVTVTDPIPAHVAAADPHPSYIPESLIDAKGDMLIGSAADTVARVPVSGTDGWVWTEDSALPNGAGWATPPTSVPAAITVREEDGTPSVNPINTLRFPDGSLVDNGGGDVSVVFAGGGGNVVYTDPYASPPVSPNAGDVWLPSDALYVLVYNGSIWVPRGYQSTAMTLPADPGTWFHQNGSTITLANGVLDLVCPTALSNNVTCRLKTIPNPTDWVLTTFVRTMSGASAMAGLVAKNSGANAFVALIIRNQNLLAIKYTNQTTVSANYISFSLPYTSSQGIWLQLEDNGTNRISRYSFDGLTWVQLHTVARTDFVTPDQYGICAEAFSGSTLTSHFLFYSLREST